MITISELQRNPNTHHRGRFILLKSIETGFDEPTVALMSLMQDQRGDCIYLGVPRKDDDRDMEELLVKGAIVMVKEPFAKIQSNGEVGIRVDHPSDILWDPISYTVPSECQATVHALKSKGNEYFNMGKYSSAAAW